MNKTAAAIFSFNRPMYLREILRSIEANENIKNVDFYFIQDGSINKFSGRIAAKNEDIQACINLWNQSTLPNKRAIYHDFNLGIGICQFEAKAYLFDKLEYSRVIFLEDDLVLSKYYIRLLQLLLDQFESKMAVGAVMCHGGHPRAFSDTDKTRMLNQIRSGNDQLWAWAMWRDRWQKIKPTFLEYYKFIAAIDYSKRPLMEIITFYEKQGISLKISSQDAALYYSFIKNECFILNTVIHRGRYIGSKGEHMYPEKYERIGFSSVQLNGLDGDAQLNRFEGYNEQKFLADAKTLFLVHNTQ